MKRNLGQGLPNASQSSDAMETNPPTPAASVGGRSPEETPSASSLECASFPAKPGVGTDPAVLVHGGHRAEYLARIHRAQDHIERHLGENLRLEDIARVGCFSPFHFHRVFGAVTGESLARFILRLRLEKAASRLWMNPAESVTTIALECGFSSAATFARAFRAAFGRTASDWRKKCKAVRKDGKEGGGDLPYLGWSADAPAMGAGATTTSPGSTSMSQSMRTVEPTDVQIDDIAAFTVAYIRHVGPYAGDSALFGRLFGRLMQWAGPHGMIRPDTRFLTIYHDDPGVTDEQKLRISVCLSVPQGTAAQGEVGILEVPAGKCLRARFDIDPSEYGAAWQWVMGSWLPESGWQPDDRPCYEVMLNDPAKHPQGRHLIEIVEPVRPL